MGEDTKPWASVIAFWLGLTGLAEKFEAKMNEWNWTVGPARGFELVILAIEHCIDEGVPTHEQPAWTMLLELYRERAKKLAGSAIDVQYSQTMSGWRDHNIWAGTPSPHPMFPGTGPLFDHVAVYDHIEAPIKAAASTLEYESGDRDRDILGRSLTVGEAANVAWTPMRQLLDHPWFKMQNPEVPQWQMPFPWLAYVENEMRDLRDSLKGSTPTLQPGAQIGSTAFSWPGV
ncbi:MAG: hypothetical protein DRH30_14275 [Deltaproteobacteria bacterium]|nr:MAG: hypothetical protein DRH30_14275 [Deltaproteobacteria bacterium]